MYCLSLEMFIEPYLSYIHIMLNNQLIFEVYHVNFDFDFVLDQFKGMDQFFLVG